MTMTHNLEIQREKGKAAIISRAECCFFCLREFKKSQTSGPACSKKNGGTQVSLKIIFDFLKFYGSGSKCDSDSMVMVPTCQDCAEMIHEFSLLYQVMEETRLRLNWCLQKLHDVMITDSKNQSRKLPKDMANLRSEAKGQLKHAVSFPRVKLRRVRLLGSSLNVTDENDATWEDSPCGSSVLKYKRKFGTSVISKQVSNPIIRKSTVSKSKTAVLKEKKARRIKTVPTASHVSCPYCRAEFPSSNKSNGAYYGTWLLRAHMLKYHLETFFPKHKHDSIGDLQFRRILADLLFQDFMVGKSCPICDWPFGIAKNKNQITTYLFNNKNHFIDAHFKELEVKLEQIQSDPDLRRKLAMIESKGRMCKNKCGVYLGTGHAEKVHLKNGCLYTKKKKVVNATTPETSNDLEPSAGGKTGIRSEIPDHSSAMTEAEASPLKVKMEVDIENQSPAKRIKVEPNDDIMQPLPPEPDVDTWFPDFESSSRSSDISNSSSTNSSESCSTSSESDSSDESASSSSNFLEAASTSTSTRKSGSRPRKNIPQEKPRKPDKSPLSCPYCRAKFMHAGRAESDNRATRLRLHYLSYHCEHFFTNMKLDLVSDFQYKKLLAELLFQSFINEDRSCQSCSKSFGEPSIHHSKSKDIGRQKLHFLREHFKELEDQLVVIQRDPELPKKLEECNPVGRMCKNECGVYISDSYAELAHDKYHCIKFANQKVFVAGVWKLDTTEAQRNAMKIQMRVPEGQEHSLSLSLHEMKSCPYCNFSGKRNSDPENLFRHVARQHSEHFFLDQIDNVSVEGIMRLRKIFEDILLPEMMPGKGDTCIHCQKVFNCRTAKDNRNALKTHLVHQHEIKLREKLKTILEDPELEEKLKGLKGEFCRCGMYFPKEKTIRKLMYHKRYFCKFLPSENDQEDKGEGSLSNLMKQEIP